MATATALKLKGVPDHCNKLSLLYTRDRLQTSLKTLEKYKKSGSLTNVYLDTIKTYGKTYHLGKDIISKIAYVASWSDKSQMLTNAVQSLALPRNIDFINGLKGISSNVFMADMIFGPIKGDILDNDKMYNNTWYNILKKAVTVAIRANAHFIKNIERHEQEILNKRLAAVEALKKQEDKIKRKEEAAKIELEEKIKAEASKITLQTFDDWEDMC